MHTDILNILCTRQTDSASIISTENTKWILLSQRWSLKAFPTIHCHTTCSFKLPPGCLQTSGNLERVRQPSSWIPLSLSPSWRSSEAGRLSEVLLTRQQLSLEAQLWHELTLSKMRSFIAKLETYKGANDVRYSKLNSCLVASFPLFVNRMGDS